jgi:replicative DNA helicase
MAKALTTQQKPSNNGHQTPDQIAAAAGMDLPSDVEAEYQAVGAALLYEPSLDETLAMLKVEDFLDEAAASVFRIMADRRAKNRPVHPEAILEALKAEKRENDPQHPTTLDRIGGAAMLGRIIHSVGSVFYPAYYCERVLRAAVQRRVLLACQGIYQATKTQEFDSPLAYLAMAENAIFEVGERATEVATADMTTTMDDVMQAMENRYNGVTAAGVPTGFTQLDNQLGGLRPRNLVIVAGRTSMGKTAMALNVVHHVATHTHGAILFVTLEMSRAELGERLLAAASQVNLFRMLNGTLGHEERARLAQTAGELAALHIFIDESPTRTVAQIAAVARRLKRKEQLALVVVDYLQLVEPEGKRENRQEQVAGISRKLKAMARQLEVPVIALAQLNRKATEGQGARDPVLSDLRESGAIEQDADAVIFCHRPDYYKQGQSEVVGHGYEEKAKFILAKNRNGPVGSCEVMWRGRFMRFDNIADDWQDGNFYEQSPAAAPDEDFNQPATAMF